MITVTAAQWAMLLLSAASAAAAALWIDGRLLSKWSKAPASSSIERDSTFLCEGDYLVDHDVDDQWPSLHFPDHMEAWAELRDWLSARFDGLPTSLSDLPDQLQIQFQAGGSAPKSILKLHRSGKRTRITLSDTSTPSAAIWHAALKSVQNGEDVGFVLSTAPDPIWRTQADGKIVWQNRACDRILDENGDLPKTDREASSANAHSPAVISLLDPKTKDNLWFELRTFKTKDDYIHFATEITQIVKAETVQREFVQTLTKTFASLTIGLAIFDKDRRLALFNPALVDLTNLPATFLSLKPELMHFFDQLRERQVMPEPKNYASWRVQIRDAVRQANDGLYQEMWTLPNSLTYRVTGRSHPNGAVAFLFEDISAEVTLTRRFRTQIELRQSILDGLADAVAVIGSNNLVLFCNKPCCLLLDVDPDSSFMDMSLRDLLSICQERFGKSPAWDAFDQAVSVPSQEAFKIALPLDEDRKIICQSKPLTGGARLLTFCVDAQTTTPVRLSAAS
jgi:PAS domain-containing protein